MRTDARRVIKAGAYIRYGDFFPFMVGFGAPDGNVLGVVRFGGHREAHESPLQCAVREVKEEASLAISFFPNAVTYTTDASLASLDRTSEGGELAPVFIRKDACVGSSVMYLAHGCGDLSPAAETQGILLLRREELRWICTERIMLKEYIKSGGIVLLAKALPEDAYLEPAIQVRFFDMLFDLEPELMERFCG